MRRPHYVTETQAVQSIARSPQCRFKWVKHALEKMEERQISSEDVICVLINGQVILEEIKQDTLWRVMGKDIDGIPLEVVVAVYEETITIKVVTAF